MKRVFLTLGTVIVILPWLAGARVQADLIQLSVLPDPGSIKSLNYGSNAEVQFLPRLPGFPISGNVERLDLTTLQLSSKWSRIGPDIARFGGSTGNYSLRLVLSGPSSGLWGSLTFRGNLSGFVNPVQVDLTNTFLSPTTQTLALGRNLYTVTLGPYVSPPPPFSGNNLPDGSISASIAVQPRIRIASIPEPTSLMLAYLGLPALGLARWFHGYRFARNGNRLRFARNEKRLG